MKVYIELGGSVHKIAIHAHAVAGIDDLSAAIAEACYDSGSPELQTVDLDSSTFHYLDGASGAAHLVTAETRPSNFRSAKAFRVVAAYL